jgi:GNAT superfamily N-acetyltransferase
VSRPPLVDVALVRRVERVGAAFMLAWLDGARQRPGNPSGIELAPFGGAVAASSSAAPELDFANRVYGPLAAADVPALARHYRERGIRPWFELVPDVDTEELTAALTAVGAAQFGFHGQFVGRVEPRRRPSAVVVREIGDPEAERFSRILLRGHELPAAALPEAIANQRHWASIPGVRLFLADLDGAPVGAGALLVRDGMGYLANAATLPSGRRRGAQTALIDARITAAADEGCELVASLATFGSTSAANLQRAGLVVACTLAAWRGG